MEKEPGKAGARSSEIWRGQRMHCTWWFQLSSPPPDEMRELISSVRRLLHAYFFIEHVRCGWMEDCCGYIFHWRHGIGHQDCPILLGLVKYTGERESMAGEECLCLLIDILRAVRAFASAVGNTRGKVPATGDASSCWIMKVFTSYP